MGSQVEIWSLVIESPRIFSQHLENQAVLQMVLTLHWYPKAEVRNETRRIGDYVQNKVLDKGFHLIYVATISLGRIFI